MGMYSFAAYALNGESDLNKIAANLAIGKKFKWEEPLVLSVADLSHLPSPSFDVPRVYLFYFGAAVFFNCSADQSSQFLKEIVRRSPYFRYPKSGSYREDYSFQIVAGAEIKADNDSATAGSEDPVLVDTIAFAIAKSVALERVEARVDYALDKMEEIIERLNQGRFVLPDKELGRIKSSILDIKLRSLSHIMVLDKPDVVWDSIAGDRLYLTLANLFELSHRYSQIKNKYETLIDITAIYANMSHAHQAKVLEWTIIILIAIEIIINVSDKIFR